VQRHEGAAPFRCGLELHDDTARVLPTGELDIDTVPFVEERLECARAAGIANVVLDLRETSFVDSTAVRLALVWHERAHREQFGFALVQCPEPVRRVMEIAGIATILNLVE
jgi:anti-anti-sigma factor